MKSRNNPGAAPPTTNGDGAGNTGVRVIVADDHPVYREGLLRIFTERAEFDLVSEVGDGAEAVAEIRRLRPAVAIVDLQLPDMDGIAVVEAVEREGLPTKVIIVSAYEDSATVYRAIAAGAQAYLPKVSSGATLCETVLAVARGETVIPPALQAGLASEIRSRRDRGSEPVLTPREIEVLRLTADGLSAPEIAERLFVGVTTVKTHLQHIYEKLEVSDRAAAVAQAHRRGLLN
jgi:two-component system nitrate/nitrite response regulator NarL